MSAALRLADARVFERVNAAMPELLETGESSEVTAHDLRHVALVVRILELEMQTSSELTNTNLLNLIISDRFLDVPTPESPMLSPSNPSSSQQVRDTRTRCDASNPLCVYAETVSVKWAMAKIAQAYRSREMMRYLRRVVRLPPLPPMSPRPFRGMPLFKPRLTGLTGKSKAAQRVRDALQDYLILYRASILREFERAPPSADDAWSRAAYALLLAERADMNVGAVLRDLRVRSLADVEDSPHLGDFIKRARSLKINQGAERVDDEDDDDGDEKNVGLEAFLIRTPDRVSHVGIYSLGSPSSETAPLR